MKIINYFEQADQAALREKIGQCDWSAAKFLEKLLKEGTFAQTLGGWGKLFLLMDGENLVSFCTLSAQDAVWDKSLTPWIGFVYTAPQYRGRRCAGLVLGEAAAEASAMGCDRVYLETDHVGLYEKYGYTYLENRIDCWGSDVRVMYKNL